MIHQPCPVCGRPATLREGPGRIGHGTQHLDCDDRHAMTAPFQEWLSAYSHQVEAEIQAWLHPSDECVDHDHDWEGAEVYDGFVLLACRGCGAWSTAE